MENRNFSFIRHPSMPSRKRRRVSPATSSGKATQAASRPSRVRKTRFAQDVQSEMGLESSSNGNEEVMDRVAEEEAEPAAEEAESQSSGVTSSSPSETDSESSSEVETEPAISPPQNTPMHQISRTNRLDTLPAGPPGVPMPPWYQFDVVDPDPERHSDSDVYL